MCQPAKLLLPDVEDLALLDGDLDGLPDLVPRRVPVDVVELVEVDVVGLQALEAGVQGAPDVQRGQLGLVGPVAHGRRRAWWPGRSAPGGRRPGRTSGR